MQYFKNHHEGLGTTYEGFILQKYFEKIQNKYSIQSVFKVPFFGMTGIVDINSMWWGLSGNRISIVDHSEERIDLIEKVWQKLSLNADFVYNSNGYMALPIKVRSFDLGWNFAALGFVLRWEEFLNELPCVSTGY